MVKVGYENEKLIVNILSNSFDVNQGVNYIVQQDEKRPERINNEQGIKAQKPPCQ